MLDLSRIQAITDTNVRTFVTTGSFKVMFTNMSNVKLCYEYYLVTPIGDQASTFQAQVTALSNSLDVGSGSFDVITGWDPQFVPELMKSYRILGKSVFRLSPGETGELHGKNKIYRQFGDTAQTLGRTYESGINTQLYCRWYGCPTGVSDTATLHLVKDAVFGDGLLATSWITEDWFNYYKQDSVNVNALEWSSNVRANVVGTETVVTHAQTDDDNTAAE